MLKFMREQASSWLIKTVLWLVVFAFIGTIFFSWGMGKMSSQAGVVATVLNEDISYEEYRRAINNLYEFYRSIVKGRKVEDVISQKDIRKAALNSIIQRKLVINRAREMGISVSKQEVVNRIRSLPAMQINGRFDKDSYMNFLSYNRKSAKDFEESQREDLLMAKVEEVIKDSVKAAEMELRSAYKLRREKINLDYLVIKPGLFDAKEELTDVKIAEFFNKGKERFRKPEQIKVEYLFADPLLLEKDIKIDEQELQEYYTDNLFDFQEKEMVRARHILIKKSPAGSNIDETKNDPNEQLDQNQGPKKKAEDLLARLKGGENFEELAKEYSEDPVSAKSGGDVGFFPRGRMVKEFDKVAFSLEVGKFSDIVESVFGYHIIQITDKKEARAKPLDEVEKEITAKLVKRKSKKLARRSLLKILKNADSVGEFKKQEHAGFVKKGSTPFFNMKKGEKIPSIGMFPQFKLEAFSLKKDEVSRLVVTGKGFYLLMLNEKKESHIPALEEVKEEVIKILSAAEKRKMAGNEADRLLKELKKGISMDTIAKQLEINVAHTDFFDRDEAARMFGMDKAFIDAVFQLKKKEFAMVPVSDKYYLVNMMDRSGFDEEKYKKDKNDFLKTFLEEKQRKVLAAWMENLRKNTEITINEQFL